MTAIKTMLMGGAALAALASAAQADELSDLKAQVESLTARVANMEAAPSAPAGYQLLAISKGAALQIPGIDPTNRQMIREGNRATIISVMPVADAPAGTTISWSGYVRAAIIYNGQHNSTEYQRYVSLSGGSYAKVTGTTGHSKSSDNPDDFDVKARGQLRVVATTDTAVGEVGVELKMRADADGNGAADLYMETAWGYWAMTPELTLGGGYNDSLGNVTYSYDGACVCYYNDDSDVNLDPGDATQMRLTYASGPLSAAVAIEDASTDGGTLNGNNLGVAGEIKYAVDSFSGAISGVYRSTDSSDYANWSGVDGFWQIGAGVAFAMGDIANFSIGAAMGEGPYDNVNVQTGDIDEISNVNNAWWGVSGLVSANLSDTVYAEAGAGYKHRKGDDYTVNNWRYSGFDYDTYAVMGGVYYNPVDQLTLGLETEWSTQSTDTSRAEPADYKVRHKETQQLEQDYWTLDLVSVWRF